MLDPRANHLPTAFANSTDRPKIIIGSANIHRPQRYAHKDPAPWLPFPDEKNTVDLEAVIYLGLASLLLAAVALLGYYML